MNIKEYLCNKFKNKRCHVLGFARSNKPLVDILLNAGAYVTVRDKNEELYKDSSAAEFLKRGADFILGEKYLDSLDGDFIFRTPAIRPDIPEIKEAVKRGAYLTGEMELFFEICPCRIFGITGSDGKTTTTTLTHLFLQREGEKKGFKAYVGGNIGAPLLPLVFEMSRDDVAVVELSSFQLQLMRFTPQRAAITNISPNHLNWHVDMGEYISAKTNICGRNMSVFVTNAENEITYNMAKNISAPITYFSSKKSNYSEIVPCGKENCNAIYEKNGVIVLDNGKEAKEVLPIGDILIPGRHNVENYMTAIALTRGVVSNETVKEVAKTFHGVEHRLELVREKDGVKFYNSSIDSSPSRTAAAISALSKAPIIILGGEDKGVPFDTLATDVCTKTKAAIVTGKSAPKILEEIEKCPDYDREVFCVKYVPDFDEAVRAAAEMASDGDIVLLSPACTSFDRFKDFAERGNHFKKIVESLI